MEKTKQLNKEEIDEKEWLRGAKANPAFDFMKELEEDIYAPEDGTKFHGDRESSPCRFMFCGKRRKLISIIYNITLCELCVLCGDFYARAGANSMNFTPPLPPLLFSPSHAAPRRLQAPIARLSRIFQNSSQGRSQPQPRYSIFQAYVPIKRHHEAAW